MFVMLDLHECIFNMSHNLNIVHDPVMVINIVLEEA